MKSGAGLARTAVSAAILFASGLIVGAFAYALLGPYRAVLDPQVQNALVLGIGAIAAALVASLGVYWAAVIAGGIAASEGAATRKETRRFALIDARTELVRRISVMASRHAQTVANQVARRQELAGKPYEPLPPIRKTTAIEDAVNELYTLGFQATGDVANALFRSLLELDGFAYVVTPEVERRPVKGLSDEEHLSYTAWQVVQKRIKTHMIDVSLTDEGVEHLAAAGTIPADYLEQQYSPALDELRPGATLAAALTDAKIKQSSATQP